MRHLVACPLPDELLSSVWVRTVRRAGLPVRTVARALTGGRKWAPGFFTAGHVCDLAPVLGLEPVELLWRHTVFPYATAFFDNPVYDVAMAAALSTGEAATGMGAVTQSASDPVRFRRFCTACAGEDRQRWGESYWHRAHNLPGVLICVHHGAVLRQTDLPTTGWKTWDERLPHELKSQRLLRRRIGDFDVELARRANALLGRVAREQLLRDSNWYRAQLGEHGLLSPARQVNADKLAQWVRSRMSGPPRDYGLTANDASLSWLALMVRPRSGHPFVPLKHLLFETALATQEQVAEPLLDHVPSGPSGRALEKFDREHAAAVRKVVAGYTRRGERVRIKDALTEAGCWSAFRHARKQLPQVAKAVAALKKSDVAMRPNWGKRPFTS